MKKHSVILLPQAEEDIGDIWRYIHEASREEKIATRFCQYLFNLCHEKLAYFPTMGRERNDLRKDLRYHPVGKYDYLIFYSIKNDELIIERIIHSSKDYTNSFS